jgi:AAA15 family ATPase/GTPase
MIMLNLFSVKNFKGFKDIFTMDFSASNFEFNPECINNGCVSKALVYGYNGVGKSNLGLALMDISMHLTDKEKPVHLYSNYFNAEINTELAEFCYQFKFNDVCLKYEYGKKNVGALIYENLYMDNKLKLSYNRNKNEPLTISIGGTETLVKDLNKIPISVLKYIRSNAVINDQTEKDILDMFFDFVDRMLLFWSLENRGYIGYSIGATNMLDDIIKRNHFDDFKKFLKEAELPANIVFKRIGEELIYFFEFEQHGKKEQKKGIEFFSTCSQGTRALTVFYYWYQYIKYSDIPPLFVFIDEFDAFYHQHLAEFVITELKKLKKCQIILTTHDTGIMANEFLRPDCLYLMYKDKIRSLNKSTDKELRFAHNIEKMYRTGAFDE